MPRVSEHHKDERRRQIIDGARQVFGRLGYDGATVAELEAEVGLSRGAIFSYFPTKRDLFVALARADHERFAAQWLDGGFEAAVRELADLDPASIGVHLETARMLRTDDDLRRRWANATGPSVDAVLQRYRDLQQAGAIRDDLPVESVVQYLGVVLDGLATQRGAGLPIDVDGALELTRAALARGRSQHRGRGS